ncbi:MAG: M15 family metallopeptidase [Flavobacteriales bacterium]|nr:M15 family metallopeptidase [Flavobacteriales bacterium]
MVQSELKLRGLYPGPADGIAGSATKAALDKVTELPKTWPLDRKLVGLLQLTAKDLGFETGPIDGLWGAQTAYAYEQLRHLRLFGVTPPVWRPEGNVVGNPNNWPTQRTDEELIAFYGQMGANQKSLALPYPHRLSWDMNKSVNAFQCHQKVHSSVVRVLTKVKNTYGMAEIQRLRLDVWGGCLNVRLMRGGDRYSTHSWGIAIDYDPENNQLKWGRDRASFARPEYEQWWQLWEEEGWVSLGRQHNFDWMHVQAAML